MAAKKHASSTDSMPPLRPAATFLEPTPPGSEKSPSTSQLATPGMELAAGSLSASTEVALVSEGSSASSKLGSETLGTGRAEAERRGEWPEGYFPAVLLASTTMVTWITFSLTVLKYGGAMVVAWFVCLLTIAFPLYVLELGLGQYASKSDVHIFQAFVPAAQGLGPLHLFYNLHFLISRMAVFGQTIIVTAWFLGNSWKDCDRLPLHTASQNCFTNIEFKHCIRTGRHEVAAHIKLPTLLKDPSKKPSREELAFQEAAGVHRHFFAARHCYSPDEAAQDFVAALEACLLKTAEVGWHDPRCRVHFHFFFNLSRTVGVHSFGGPAVSFNLGNVTEGEAFCEGWVPFELYSDCSADYSRWATAAEFPWAAPFPPEEAAAEFHVRLIDWSQKDVRRAAGCLGNLTLAAAFDDFCNDLAVPPEQLVTGGLYGEPRRPRLWCMLRFYCDRTWPTETLTDVQCLNRVLNPYYDYSVVLLFNNLTSGWLDQPHVGAFVLSWEAALGHLGAWLLVWIVVSCPIGVRARLFAAFVVTPATLAMVTLFICAFRYEGTTAGILYLFRVEWCALFDIHVWVFAVVLTLGCLGVSQGLMTTLGSYQPFHADFVKMAFAGLIGHFGTAILYACLLCGFIGMLGEDNFTSMDRLMDSPNTWMILGFQGTVNVASESWIICFCSMGVLAYLSVAFEVFLTALEDEWNFLRPYRRTFAGIVGSVFALASLPWASTYGGWIVTKLDRSIMYAFGIPSAGCLLICVLNFNYGVERVLGEMRTMLAGGDAGPRFGRWMLDGWFASYLRVTWHTTVPLGTFLFAALGGLTAMFGDQPKPPDPIQKTLFLMGGPLVVAICFGLGFWYAYRRGPRATRVFTSRLWGPQLLTAAEAAVLPSARAALLPFVPEPEVGTPRDFGIEALPRGAGSGGASKSSEPPRASDPKSPRGSAGPKSPRSSKRGSRSSRHSRKSVPSATTIPSGKHSDTRIRTSDRTKGSDTRIRTNDTQGISDARPSDPAKIKPGKSTPSVSTSAVSVTSVISTSALSRPST